MNRFRVLSALVLLTACFGSLRSASAGSVYWTNETTHTITRRDVAAGSTVETVVTGADFPAGLAVDGAGGKFYWTDPVQDVIRRANLDGTGQQTLLSGMASVPHPFDIRVDAAGGAMYWADDVAKKIRRSNLDGTGVVDILNISGLYTGASIYGIDLDLANQRLYWSDRFTGNIQRVNLDGTGVTTLVSGNFFTPGGPASPFGLRLDLAGGKVYWADTVNDKIQRANLDGSMVEDVITKNSFTDPNVKFSPFGLSLDPAGGRLYWTNKSNTPRIQSSLLDGTDIVDVQIVTGNPLAIDFVSQSIAEVPEPSSLLLMILGGLAAPIFLLHHRRTKVR